MSPILQRALLQDYYTLAGSAKTKKRIIRYWCQTEVVARETVLHPDLRNLPIQRTCRKLPVLVYHQSKCSFRKAHHQQPVVLPPMRGIRLPYLETTLQVLPDPINNWTFLWMT